MKTIALYVSDPYVSVQSCNGVLKAFQHRYNLKLFSKNKLEEGFFDNVDMVVVPGGIGDADSYDKQFKKNEQEIKQFISRGGKYLGICMGAYWAGSQYLNILDEIDTVQYIKRPYTDTKRPHAKDLKVYWHGVPTNMFFYDGCAIVGNYGKMELIAKYENDDWMAAIQNNIGLIGCHPEAEQWWYDSYSYMKGKWTPQFYKLIEVSETLLGK